MYPRPYNKSKVGSVITVLIPAPIESILTLVLENTCNVGSRASIDCYYINKNGKVFVLIINQTYFYVTSQLF